MWRGLIAAKVGIKSITNRRRGSAAPGHRSTSLVQAEDIVRRGDFNRAGVFSSNTYRSQLFITHCSVVVRITKKTKAAFAPSPAEAGTEMMMVIVVVCKPVQFIYIKLVGGKGGLVNGRAIKLYYKF